MLCGPVMPSFSLNLVDVALLLLQMGMLSLFFVPSWPIGNIYRLGSIRTHNPAGLLSVFGSRDFFERLMPL